MSSSYTRPGSIELPKVLNQQFRKHSDLSRGVVPRRSHNEDSDFGERISIHERYQGARRQVVLDQEFRQRGYAEPGDGRRRKSQSVVRLKSSLRVHGDRLVSINEDPGLRALHETFMREELFRRFGSAVLLDIFGAADELATDRRDLPRHEGRITELTHANSAVKTFADDEILPAGDLRGRLRIAAPLSFGPTHLAPVLAQLARRHPRLHLQCNYSDRFGTSRLLPKRFAMEPRDGGSIAPPERRHVDV